MKTWTMILVMLGMSVGLGAQTFHLGIKGGWNLSTVRDIPQGVEDFDINNRNGFHLGGFTEWYLGENVAIVGELLFSGKGTTLTFVDSLQVKRESTVKLHYITLPLLLQVAIGPVNLQAGPEFGLQVDQDIQGYNAENGAFNESFWDNNFDMSVVGGATFNVGNLFVGARYGLSLNKFGEYTKTDVQGNPDGRGTYGKNSFWQLSVGFRIL